MSSHIILTIPAPGAWLRTNSREHFHQRAKDTRLWREAAAWEARRQRVPKFTVPVAITATIHRADKRIHDLDGFAPTLKATIDGLRDVGVLVEDDFRYVPSITICKGEQWADAAIVLRIETVGGAA